MIVLFEFDLEKVFELVLQLDFNVILIYLLDDNVVLECLQEVLQLREAQGGQVWNRPESLLDTRG